MTVPQLSLFDDLALDGLALTLLIFSIHNRLVSRMNKEEKYNVEMQTVSIIKITKIYVNFTGTNHIVFNWHIFIIFWRSFNRRFFEQKFNGIKCWGQVYGKF